MHSVENSSSDGQDTGSGERHGAVFPGLLRALFCGLAFVFIPSYPAYTACVPGPEWQVSWTGVLLLGAATDPSGNVIVCGYNESGNADMWIRKYDSNGGVVWSRSFGGEFGGNDYGRWVATDGDGNVVCVGSVEMAAGDSEWQVNKYSPTGDLLWTRTYSGPPTGGSDSAERVAIDGSSNIVVAGTEGRNDLSEGLNARIIKYSPQGDVLWSRYYNKSLWMDNTVTGVAADSSGNVFVVGSLYYYGPFVAVISKYDSVGNLEWSRSCYAEPYTYGPASFNSLVVDAQGNAVVGGASGDYYNGAPIVWKYGPDGTALWAKRLHEPYYYSYNSQRVTALSLGAGDRIFVAGDWRDVWHLVYLEGDSSQIFEISHEQTCNQTTFGASGDLYALAWPYSVVKYPFPPCMSSALVSPSQPVVVGQWRDITLEVSNTGGHKAFAVAPAVEVNRGWGLAHLESSPAPADVPGGETRQFTWTYSISGAGAIGVTVTATGYDIMPANTIAVASSTEFMAGAEGYISAQCSLSNPQPCVGDWIEVSLVTGNPGYGAAENVNPAIQVNSAAGVLVPISGPVPAGPVTIPGGGFQYFRWTFSVSGAGLLSFTATATGNGSGTGVFLSAVAGAVGYAGEPAKLSSSLAMVPEIAPAANHLDVCLSVANNGFSAAQNVVPSLAVTGGANLLSFIVGPSPAGPVSLQPGGSAVFCWTFSVAGDGFVEMSATASGTDARTGGAISSTAMIGGPMTMFFLAPGRVLVTGLSVLPSPVRQGGEFEARLTVSNSGGLRVSGVTASLTLSDLARARIIEGPVPAGPATLEPNRATTFAWKVRAVNRGSVTMAALASGMMGGIVVSRESQAPQDILPGYDAQLVTYPNPVAGDAFTVGINLDEDAYELVVEVFNLGYEPVYRGTWRNVTTLDQGVQVSGVSRWAPGVYFLKVHAKTPGGVTKKFPVAKVVIKRGE